MKTSTRVAAYALLLVGFTSAEAAANGGAHEEGGHEEGPGTIGTVGDPPVLSPTCEDCSACEGEGCEDCEENCALENEEGLSLQERIATLEKELAELRRQLSAMKAKPTQQPDSAEQHEALERRIGALEQEISALREKLGKQLPWAGWKAQVVIGGMSWPVMNGASNPPVTRYVEVDGRYVWANHLGIGGTTSLLGFWVTDDDQGDGALPWTGSGRLYAVANWTTVAVTVGPELTYLQNPTDGKQGFVLVTTPVGLEFRPARSFFVRAFVGPAVASELQRTSGLWLGIGVGIPLYPWVSLGD